jgi:hypothetical protein
MAIIIAGPGVVPVALVYVQSFWTLVWIKCCCCVIDENSLLNKHCCSTNDVMSHQEYEESEESEKYH